MSVTVFFSSKCSRPMGKISARKTELCKLLIDGETRNSQIVHVHFEKLRTINRLNDTKIKTNIYLEHVVSNTYVIIYD